MAWLMRSKRPAMICALRFAAKPPSARSRPTHAATRGVVLADNSQLSKPAVVASSVDAHLTFERLLSPDELPEEFRAAVAKIDYSSASAKINFALGRAAAVHRLPSSGVGPHHHGTMHIGPTMDYIERAYDDAKYGRPSEEPILEMTMPTSVDSTIAPDGKHMLSMFVQYAPYKLAEGSIGTTSKSRSPIAASKNSPATLRMSPRQSNIAKSSARWIWSGPSASPAATSCRGRCRLHQLYCFRPVAGWSDHRTPVPGLYLCGAASHPGGGVMGACGDNAAQEILRDKA